LDADKILISNINFERKKHLRWLDISFKKKKYSVSANFIDYLGFMIGLKYETITKIANTIQEFPAEIKQKNKQLGVFRSDCIIFLYVILLSFQLKCSSNIDSIHYLGLTNSFDRKLINFLLLQNRLTNRKRTGSKKKFEFVWIDQLEEMNSIIHAIFYQHFNWNDSNK
jgi:hypothetical protein